MAARTDGSRVAVGSRGRLDAGERLYACDSGTQHLDLQHLKTRTDVANVLRSGMDDAAVEDSKAIDLVLEAGDVLCITRALYTAPT